MLLWLIARYGPSPSLSSSWTTPFFNELFLAWYFASAIPLRQPYVTAMPTAGPMPKVAALAPTRPAPRSAPAHAWATVPDTTLPAAAPKTRAAVSREIGRASYRERV